MKFTGRWKSIEDFERLGPWIFGVAAAFAAGLILFLGRGTIYSIDELPWVIESPHLSLGDAMRPYNGHLVVTSRLLYKGGLEIFGDNYLTFRLMGVASVVLISSLVYVYARRRIGGLAALAPALILLVFGSDYVHVIVGNATTVLLALACGVGAFLALERDERRGDITACLLLCLGVATYSVALAFVVGAGIWGLSTPRRWKRLWVAAVPLALYAAWWLWALKFPSGSENQLSYSNILLIPSWTVQAFGAAMGALTGISYNFGPPAQGGTTLFILAAVAIGWRLRRPPTPALLAGIGVVFGLAAIEVIARNAFVGPDIARYLYPGAVALIVVGSEAARDIDWNPRALAGLGAVAVMGIATNLVLLSDSSKDLRNVYAPEVRAEFTGLELAGAKVDPEFDKYKVLEGSNALIFPFAEVAVFSDSPATSYVEAADAYGDLGYSADELETSDELARTRADAVLVEALMLELKPTIETGGTCRRLTAGASGAIDFKLPGAGTVLSTSGAEASVTARRFADTAVVALGTVTPGQSSLLTVTPDDLGRPWKISVAAPSLKMCSPSQ